MTWNLTGSIVVMPGQVAGDRGRDAGLTACLVVWFDPERRPMSRTVDLFLDSDQPLELVASELSELAGAPLSASPDRSRFVLRYRGVTAYLAEHDFLDDDDLPLSEFSYVLSAKVRGAGDIDRSPEAQCLRELNARWRSGTGMPSLLVIDLERPDTSELGPNASGLGSDGLGLDDPAVAEGLAP